MSTLRLELGLISFGLRMRTMRQMRLLVLTAWLVVCCYATVPVDLTNFQNEYACDTSTLIVR